MKNTEQLNLEVTKETRARLESLVARGGGHNLTEVVRKALALYDLALDHVADGGKLIFRHASGTDETLRIL